MAAGQNDFYTKIAQPGSATSLAAPGHTIAGTSINVDSTALWPTDTAVIFAIDTVTIGAGGIEIRDANSYTVWRGVVALATTISNMTLMYGTDQNYPAGTTTRVYQLPTASRENRMVDGLTLAGLNQDGTQTPVVKTSINDVSGNEVIKTPATASAVNEITVTNAATGNSPTISATGGDPVISLNLKGKGLGGKVTIGAGAATIFPYDYVVSGCVWTADAAGSTRVASMTAGVVVINGNPIAVAAVVSRTFTASKDVYVDVLDNGDGTGLLVYTDGTTNAASGALASNSIRLAIVVVGAGNIAAAASINQGQEDRILPIASSIPYAVTDSLGNLICPRDPNRKILGYRQILADFSTVSTSVVQMTGLSCPVIIPTGRKIRVIGSSSFMTTNGGAGTVRASVWLGTVGSGTQIGEVDMVNAAASQGSGVYTSPVTTPASASLTYNLGLRTSANTGVFSASATIPAYIMVELI